MVSDTRKDVSREVRTVARETSLIGGLCRDCSKANTCTIPDGMALPLWSCEEYDNVGDAPDDSSSIARIERGE
jgi:hypothetical protein